MKISVRRKILVIEEQTGVLTAIMLPLKRAGFCVFSAPTGKCLFERVREAVMLIRGVV